MDLSKLAVIKSQVDAAYRALDEARSLLSTVVGPEAATDPELLEFTGASYTNSEGERVVEGMFNGVEMVDAEGGTYPVPVNYASKSKLIAGDQLKLTISNDGRFIYKPIGPVNRKYLIGSLTFENGNYKVITPGKSYKVLLASVTYYKLQIGDEVTIIVPESLDSEWASIEAVIPKIKEPTE